MAFMKKTSVTSVFFPFFYMLTSFIDEKSRNTLSVYGEGAIEHSLSNIMALRLRKRFQASFNWFFVFSLFVILFVTAETIEYRQFLIPIYRNIGICKPMEYFTWFVVVFITLNFFVSNNYKQICQLYCLCSLLSNCYQTLSWTGPISFLVNYKFFCLFSILSDYILILVLSFVF